MKYLYNGRHIKTIPKEFAAIPHLEFYIEDEFDKRLNLNERKSMTHALFQHRARNFISNQRKNELLDTYLGESKLIDAVKVITPVNHYFAIRFEGDKLLKCPYEVYAYHSSPGLIRKL